MKYDVLQNWVVYIGTTIIFIVMLTIPFIVYDLIANMIPAENQEEEFCENIMQ